MELNIDSMSENDILNFDISSLDNLPETTEPVKTEPVVETEVVEEELNKDTTEVDVKLENTEPSEENSEVVKEEEVDSVDYTSVVKKLMTEGVKVGGNRITITDPSEIETLIQRGLGANKRMQDLKPKLNMLATLEEHGLIDKEKINFMVDIMKGNPNAIAKLVKDSKIDVLDVEDNSSEYKPSDYSIPEAQLELQEVLEDMKDHPKYTDTVNLVKRLDTQSKSLIGKNPRMFATLAVDMEQGVYDQIANIVHSEQAKGNLTTLSFLEAYSTVVNTIKEDLARNSGGNEAGHNSGLTRYLTNGSFGASPHNASNGNTRKQGSSEPNNSGSKNVTSVGSATKAAMEVAKTGINNKSSNKTVIDIRNMSDAEILKLPLTAFE